MIMTYIGWFVNSIFINIVKSDILFGSNNGYKSVTLKFDSKIA